MSDYGGDDAYGDAGYEYVPALGLPRSSRAALAHGLEAWRQAM